MNTASRRLTVVWLGLVLLTSTTTWGMTTHGIAPAVAMAGIFVIAAFKVALVMFEFMELRHAPWPVRAVFGTWVVAVTAVILTFWFITPDVT